MVLKNKQLITLASVFKVNTIKVAKKHVLSHQHLYAVFYEIQLPSPLKAKGLLKVKKTDLNNFAMPQLINKYLY